MVIIDNFIKDKVLLNSICNDISIWNSSYNWIYKSSIINFSSPINNLIKKIWVEGIGSSLVDLNSVEGFEWWSGVYKAGDRKETKDLQDNNFYHLFKHFDKDEKIWELENIVVNPMIGTVFYPDQSNIDVIGGELIVWQTDEPDISVPYERILPKYNRLVIFDPSNLHAVKMVTQGTRRAIAINLWNKKPRTFYE